MAWTEYQTGSAKVFSLRTEAKSFDEIGPALAEWLVRVFNEVQSLPDRIEWNRLSMEAWLDSGRLIAYPALGSYEVSSWPVAVELKMPFLIEEYDRVANEDGDDQSSSVLEYRLWMALRQAFRAADVKRRLASLKNDKVFTIWRQTRGDLSTASQFLV